MVGRWSQSPSECVTQERGGKPWPVSELSFGEVRTALMVKRLLQAQSKLGFQNTFTPLNPIASLRRLLTATLRWTEA